MGGPSLGDSAGAAWAEGEAMTLEQTLDALPLLFSALDKEFVDYQQQG
jgi:hypothetical protein